MELKTVNNVKQFSNGTTFTTNSCFEVKAILEV